jgi:hypothetical protein
MEGTNKVKIIGVFIKFQQEYYLKSKCGLLTTIRLSLYWVPEWNHSGT